MRPLPILLLLLPICAQSQPPSPAPGKSIQEIQDKRSDTSSKADVSQPTPSVIAKEDGGKGTGQSKQPPTDNRIVWLTGALVLVGAIQIFVYLKQAGYMRDGLKETRKAANAAHDTFLSTHRPRLEIRNILPMNTNLPSLPSAGILRLINTGETEATVTGYFLEIFVGPRLPRIPPYDGKHPTPVQESLKPGGFLPIHFPSIPVDYIQSGHYAGLENHRERAKHERVVSTLIDPLFIFLVGFVNYSDRANNARRKGVCFKYDFRYSRFEQEADPDYDYGG
jgi:hypothetical protein